MTQERDYAADMRAVIDAETAAGDYESTVGTIRAFRPGYHAYSCRKGDAWDLSVPSPENQARGTISMTPMKRASPLSDLEGRMATLPLAADQASIVIRGKFRPEALSPDWMLAQGLLSKGDIEDCRYELLMPSEIAVYQAGWVRFQIQARVFQITTGDPADFERLRDLATGVLLGQPETPTALMGINRMVHFTTPDKKHFHTVGDRLANNDIWAGVLAVAGMKSLATWGVRPDEYGGRVQIQVEPSNVYPLAIFVAVNDHFDLTTVTSQPKSREDVARPDNTELNTDKTSVAMKILSEEWGASMSRSTTLIEHVMRQAR